MIPASDPSPLPDEIKRLQRRQRDGDHAEVLHATSILLKETPENRDLLLLEASSLRTTNRIDDALASLARLGEAHPRFSRLHQERGLCHVARRDAASAIPALLQAVNLNPALPASWRMLDGVYRLTGDHANAAIAAGHVATLAALPAPVVAATALFHDGDLAPAEEMVRAFLLAEGDHPEAMRLLAKIGMARDVLDDAELLLEAALALAPDHRPLRHDYAQCLIQRHKFAQASVQIERLLADDPGDPDLRTLAATAAVGLGDNERAAALYRQLATELPHAADLRLWLGHALKTVAALPEAIEAYRAAAELRPDFGDAYWSLANLKTYRFTDQEIALMRQAETSPGTAAEDRAHLLFALGKALEDRGDIAGSWDHYVRGNAVKRAASGYRPERMEANTSAQIATCTPAFFAARSGWGAQGRDPIFVVGLPRAGSTLIEQILASHPLVEGTQELAEVQRIVLDLQGRDADPSRPRYPDMLTGLTHEDAMRLGQRYLAETRVYRTDRAFFIDKMPNNFRHIGLIHLMLPNARIIDARREPMACCFSNLKQLFANGQEFTYSIEDIARYYRTYLELMRHWDHVLPGRVLRVQHEDVVDDLEGSVRRLLDHCGLPFDQACVEFHRSRRSVRTPSAEQVRQPINRNGVDAWRPFETELRPLRSALGAAISTYRR